MKKEAFIAFLLSLSLFGNAQTVSADMEFLKDYYRRQQLLEKFDLNQSFSIFPLKNSRNENLWDYSKISGDNKLLNIGSSFRLGRDKITLNILPFQIHTQYNSHHPEGYNDAGMIPNRGLQTAVSAGIYLKFGRHLELQLQPEFIYAANKTFLVFPNWFNQVYYKAPTDHIDYPERFGTKSYVRLLPGESSIRFNFNSVSIGLSTENLWWGPGMRNSILMSTTAPGFFHLSFNSTKPVQTKIGSFEWQVICGRLDDSGFTKDLPDDWRYINAMVLTYSPKWIPGLFLGSVRSFMIYNKDMGSSLADYLPVFIPGGKSGDEFSSKREQMESYFVRWVWPKSIFEIYGEYGKNTHARTDLGLGASSFSNAYILGFRKLFPLNAYKKTFINLNFEMTQMEVSQTNSNLHALSWYQQPYITHGYTHRGQLLGAGIGPGSNLQTLKINWVRELKSIGLMIERYLHNNDFWYEGVKDIRAHWVDMSITAFCDWDYRNLLFSFNFRFVKSFNYQWVYNPGLDSFWSGDGLDPFNFVGQVSIYYKF